MRYGEIILIVLGYLILWFILSGIADHEIQLLFEEDKKKREKDKIVESLRQSMLKVNTKEERWDLTYDCIMLNTIFTDEDRITIIKMLKEVGVI